MRASDARIFLETPANLATDKGFWGERSLGLAVFRSPKFFAAYRLPATFTENVTVADRFHVKPLIPVLQNQCRFHMLMLSQNDVAMYSMTEHSCDRVPIAGLPENMEDALGYDGADRGEQVHSAMRGSLGKQAAVFHGQGGSADTAKKDLTSFCRLVDKAVSRALHDDPDPLLLACVDYIAPIYREVNSFPRLLDATLAGNHDHQNIKRMHEQALGLVRPHFQQQIKAEVNRYRHHAETKQTCAEIDQVIVAAREGRVDVLFVDPRATILGQVSPDGGAVTVTNNSNDEDLIDLAIVEALRTGGEVYSSEEFDLPTNSPIAAILRY
jgi:hypothetical protein